MPLGSDGGLPVGIRFQSKHSGGKCWAYWLRRRDDGLDEVAMESDVGMQIQQRTVGRGPQVKERRRLTRHGSKKGPISKGFYG